MLPGSFDSGNRTTISRNTNNPSLFHYPHPVAHGGLVPERSRPWIKGFANALREFSDNFPECQQSLPVSTNDPSLPSQQCLPAKPTIPPFMLLKAPFFHWLTRVKRKKKSI